MSRVIGQREVSDFSDKLAWKRSGFTDREALEQAVRDLPIEKKVEMLTELNIGEMSRVLFNEKQNFLLNLGHKTWVDGEEIHEHAVKIFGKDDHWIINDVICFQPVHVFAGSYVEQMNGTCIDKKRDQRKKK